MATITIQALFGLIVFIAVVTARPNFQAMKLKISQDAHLTIPIIRYRIGHVPNFAKGFLAPSILGFGMKQHKDFVPEEYNTEGSKTSELNYYHHTTVSSDLVGLEENVISDDTISTSDNYMETTTETDTTTDLWTTTEDYNIGISNRIAVSPQVVATLLG